MASPDIQIRDGIAFEWLDHPTTPNRRWRARMSRSVFATLVKEKLGVELADAARASRRRTHFPRPVAGSPTQRQTRKTT